MSIFSRKPEIRVVCFLTVDSCFVASPITWPCVVYASVSHHHHHQHHHSRSVCGLQAVLTITASRSTKSCSTSCSQTDVDDELLISVQPACLSLEGLEFRLGLTLGFEGERLEIPQIGCFTVPCLRPHSSGGGEQSVTPPQTCPVRAPGL